MAPRNLLYVMTSSCPDVFACEVLLSCWIAGVMPFCTRFLCWTTQPLRGWGRCPNSAKYDPCFSTMFLWEHSSQHANASLSMSQCSLDQPPIFISIPSMCLREHSSQPTIKVILNQSHISISVMLQRSARKEVRPCRLWPAAVEQWTPVGRRPWESFGKVAYGFVVAKVVAKASSFTYYVCSSVHDFPFTVLKNRRKSGKYEMRPANGKLSET